MSDNPYLKVFAACGYYDLATPWYAMQYSRDHLHLPPTLRENFSTEFYEAGHMMYVHEPSLAKLRADLVAFYEFVLKADGDH
jgi:carboxypeptidase C (cathepsin A)